MAMPVAVPTVKVPDVSAVTATGQSNAGNGSSSGTRDFGEVLKDAAAKSQTDKGNSGDRADAGAPAQAGDDTQQPSANACECKAGKPENASATPAAETQADAATEEQAATLVISTGNDLPVWGAMLPAAMEFEAVRGAPLPAAVAETATLPAAAPTATLTQFPAAGQGVIAARAAGSLPATVLPGTAGRQFDAKLETQTPAGKSDDFGLTLVRAGVDAVKVDNTATAATDFNVELAALSASNTSASHDRSTLLARLDPALNLASPAIPTQTTAFSPPASTAAPAQAAITVPLNHPQWQDAFAARVLWQARDGLQQVNLALNPQDLGPIEVRMSISDDKVSAQFLTHHHAVRQVIEDAMPRLRDMLSQSGLNLADASVFQQTPGRDGQAQGFADQPGEVSNPQLPEAEPSLRTGHIAHAGLIDAYV